MSIRGDYTAGPASFKGDGLIICESADVGLGGWYDYKMRQPRLTYTGAFHHGMNRGHNRENIFPTPADKRTFLRHLGECAVLHGIRILAYCVMDNHHHLILQNVSGRLSQFFRHLHTRYAFHYRKTYGGSGYVFQNRFQSTLIAGDEYLKMAILYVLNNPIRAGITDRFEAYPWSSGKLCIERECPSWLDGEFVVGFFGSVRRFIESVHAAMGERISSQATPLGPVLTGDDLSRHAFAMFERRKRRDGVKRRRADDFGFEPVKKVVWEFERRHGVKADRFDTGTIEGKRLRGELLVRLKDLAGLTYKEIAELPVFSDLRFHSLSHLYKNAKGRLFD